MPRRPDNTPPFAKGYTVLLLQLLFVASTLFGTVALSVLAGIAVRNFLIEAGWGVGAELTALASALTVTFAAWTGHDHFCNKFLKFFAPDGK